MWPFKSEFRQAMELLAESIAAEALREAELAALQDMQKIGLVGAVHDDSEYLWRLSSRASLFQFEARTFEAARDKHLQRIALRIATAKRAK